MGETCVFWLVVLGLALTLLESSVTAALPETGPMCVECEAANPAVCGTRTVRCNPGEQCYVQKGLSSDSNIQYTMGCFRIQGCQALTTQSHGLLPACCSTPSCNWLLAMKDFTNETFTQPPALVSTARPSTASPTPATSSATSPTMSPSTSLATSTTMTSSASTPLSSNHSTMGWPSSSSASPTETSTVATSPTTATTETSTFSTTATTETSTFSTTATTETSTFSITATSTETSTFSTTATTEASTTPSSTTASTSTTVTTPSTTMTDTSTVATTTTTMATTTPPPGKATQCNVCSGPECFFSRDMVTCSGATPYCMNALIGTGDGLYDLTKRCASDYECRTLWWLESSDDGDCRYFDVSNALDLSFKCYYCCVQDMCNMGPYPDQTALYRPDS